MICISVETSFNPSLSGLDPYLSEPIRCLSGLEASLSCSENVPQSACSVWFCTQRFSQRFFCNQYGQCSIHWHPDLINPNHLIFVLFVLWFNRTSSYMDSVLSNKKTIQNYFHIDDIILNLNKNFNEFSIHAILTMCITMVLRYQYTHILS